MANSLRDQLLKVGLVDEEKVKAVDEEKSRRRQRGKQNRPAGARESSTRTAGSSQKSRKGRRSGAGTGNRAAAKPRGDRAQAAGRATRPDRAARERDAARARERREERKALKARIVDIIERRRHPRKDAEIAWNFLEGKRVKHLYVTPALRDGLAAGSLDLVRLGSGYEVVDAEVAEKLRLLDASVVVPRRDRSAEEEEAAYADHPIPDDLDW